MWHKPQTLIVIIIYKVEKLEPKTNILFGGQPDLNVQFDLNKDALENNN